MRAALSVSALLSGMRESDFSGEAFRDGLQRAVVVDAGLRPLDRGRIAALRVSARDVNATEAAGVAATRAAEAALAAARAAAAAAAALPSADAPPSPPLSPPPSPALLVALSYEVTFDSAADADVYAASAARATDYALAAAANERSNMRAARVEALRAPPTRRPVAAPPLPSQRA